MWHLAWLGWGQPGWLKKQLSLHVFTVGLGNELLCSAIELVGSGECTLPHPPHPPTHPPSLCCAALCCAVQYMSRPFIKGDRIQLKSLSGSTVLAGVVEQIRPLRTVIRTDAKVPVGCSPPAPRLPTQFCKAAVCHARRRPLWPPGKLPGWDLRARLGPACQAGCLCKNGGSAAPCMPMGPQAGGLHQAVPWRSVGACCRPRCQGWGRLLCPLPWEVPLSGEMVKPAAAGWLAAGAGA